jgi:hypothetical protein
MAKITLTHLTNLQNENTAVSTVNANTDTIVSSFDNTLSRDGTTPNQMMNNLDMNSNQIYNLPSPGSATSPARLQDVTGSVIISSVPPTGTSGAVVGFLNGNNTYSGNDVFSGNNTFTGTNTFTNAAPITVGANSGNNGLINFKGSTSGTTVVQATAAASGTLTLPAATDTLIGKATTDTLTNKTLDTAGTGNVFKINGTSISAITGTGSVVLATSPTLVTPNIGVATGTSLAATGLIKSSGTAGIGYATGAGGTVTQGTSKSTGVTLNTITGQITTNNASLAANTGVSFVLTNSTIAATDMVLTNIISGATNPGKYTITTAPAGGSVTVTIYNTSAGALVEALVIQFIVLKAVTA